MNVSWICIEDTAYLQNSFAWCQRFNFGHHFFFLPLIYPHFCTVFTQPHYSKSQIFVQKFNFDKTPTFSRVFHPNFFFANFSREIELANSYVVKSPKPQHFHEFFTKLFCWQFSREIKVEFSDEIWRLRNSVPTRTTWKKSLFQVYFLLKFPISNSKLLTSNVQRKILSTAMD